MSGVEESQDAKPKPILQDVDIVAVPRNYDISDSAWLSYPPSNDVPPKKGTVRRRGQSVTGAVEDRMESRMSARKLEADKKKNNNTITKQETWKTNVSSVGMKATPVLTSPTKAPKIVHWLKDEGMLRETFKFGRILLLRLTGSLSSKYSPSTDEVADNLLRLLSESRKTCRKRPIVFIGHDIGVVVIEKALILSSQSNTTTAEIFRSTAGVVFLSSPIPKIEIDAEQELDYFETTAREFQGPENFRYRGFKASDSVEPYLEKFKATLKKAEKTTLRKGQKRELDDVSAAPSAISLNRYQYRGKITKTEDVVYLQIINTISSSVECYQLLSVACKGDIQALRSIIDLGVGVNLRDRIGNAALHLAAINGQTETIKVLLHDFGANVALKNLNGRSALFLTVDSGANNIDVVRLLLKNGARANEKDKTQESPLSISRNPRVLREIHKLLKNPPLVEGPRDVLTTESWRKPLAPDSIAALDACRSFTAVVAEFFQFDKESKEGKAGKEGKEESFVLDYPSLYQLLYKSSPEKILEKARKRASNDGTIKQEQMEKDLSCRWYHIPANNVGARYLFLAGSELTASTR